MKKKHIALYHASGHDLPFQNTSALEQWVNAFDEMTLIADISPALLSVPAHPKNAGYISRIARRIVRDWSKYDGFIVILDQHSFVFTVRLLNAILPNAGKPVVCVTSTYRVEFVSVHQQRHYIDIELRSQLLNAVQLSTMDISGVLLAMEGKVMSAAVAAPANNQLAFGVRAVGNEYYGNIAFGMQLFPESPRRSIQQPVQKDIIDFSELIIVDIDVDTSFDIAGEVKTALVRSDNTLPLSVVELLPHGCRALLVAPDAFYFYVNGTILPLNTEMDADVLAAQCVWGMLTQPGEELRYLEAFTQY